MHTINLEFPVRNTMSTIILELSDELHERVQELATKNKVSINLLVTTALTENILTPYTERYFAERNQKSRYRRFSKAVPKVT